MRVLCLGVVLAFSASTALAADMKLSPADTAAAFKAAGFAKKGNRWEGCGDPGTAAYTPGAIDLVRDLNGDGQPEAVISEGSSYCFGNTGMGYAIVSKQAAGGWKLINGGPGIPNILAAKGAGEILLTSMDRDGTKGGYNLPLTRAIADAVAIPVIASGGVAGEADILALKAIAADGIAGVICGRAIYDGRLDLGRALAIAA